MVNRVNVIAAGKSGRSRQEDGVWWIEPGGDVRREVRYSRGRQAVAKSTLELLAAVRELRESASPG